MFKNKKIVLFLLVLPLVAVLVAPKVALADDDSDWVKNIPIIGGVVDFASDPGGWITDRFAEGAEFFFNDGLQNIKTTSTKSILGKSFNNLLGKKTGTFYSTVSFVNKSVVMPTAASILTQIRDIDTNHSPWQLNVSATTGRAPRMARFPTLSPALPHRNGSTTITGAWKTLSLPKMLS